jgi:hypothetical protein
MLRPRWQQSCSTGYVRRDSRRLGQGRAIPSPAHYRPASPSLLRSRASRGSPGRAVFVPISGPRFGQGRLPGGERDPRRRGPPRRLPEAGRADHHCRRRRGDYHGALRQEAGSGGALRQRRGHAAAREVDLRRKYHRSATELAKTVGPNSVRRTSLRPHLGVDSGAAQESSAHAPTTWSLADRHRTRCGPA